MKRGRDSSDDKNIERARKILKSNTMKKQLSVLKGPNVSLVQNPVRSNLRVSGNIGRFNNVSSSSVEKKFLDTYSNGDYTTIVPTGIQGFFNTTPTAIPINQVPQGTGPSQRIGLQVVVESIQIRANLIIGVQAPAQVWGAVVQMYVVLDTQANGVIPSPADIWQPYLGTGGTGTTILNTSHMNITNSGRFRILMKKQYEFQPKVYYNGTNLGRANQVILIDEFMKCKIPIRFSTTNTTGATSGITDNNIWVFLVCDYDSGGLIQFSDPVSRIRYTDA